MDIDNLLIKAVLFDFDGTLTKPGALDFSVIKTSLGCPADIPVLEFILGIRDENRRRKAIEELDAFEDSGAAESKPAEGAETLIRFLRSGEIPVGIISRNSRQSIERALDNFSHIESSDFDLIVSRDDRMEPKPHPAGILYAAEYFRVSPANLLMVGDYVFDIDAGNRAQTPTVLITNGKKMPGFSCHPDVTVADLNELKEFIRLHLPLPAGKFPNDLLQNHLDAFNFDDSQLLIRPGIGEDTAAVSVENEDVIVLKSDPITFATDAIGHYAVLVNANDIATAGADPRWLLTTLLFPCQTTPAKIFGVMRELETHCRKWHITLCGGHTEISDAVTRPVISGMMVGSVARPNLVDKRNMRPGDRVLITKAAAVEGTSLIAREFPRRLMDLGVTATEIDHYREFIERISILPEARNARRIPGVSAMHDVTEGGLATAVWELGVAGKHTLRIDLDRIPIYPETRKICDLLGIDPLGLIGSGSLLICCQKADCDRLIDNIRKVDIEITVIGEVLAPGDGVQAMRNGQSIVWPEFAADEITRLL
jgi:HAD superfamily hydrolase (TIGR01549 family)